MKLVGLAAFYLTCATPATAITFDHLRCYKVKDPLPKATYTANLEDFDNLAGCTIKVPAIMACVPALKTNVDPPPPGGGGSGATKTFGCYKINARGRCCPRYSSTINSGVAR